MGVLPVIGRELIAQARQPATHGLRVAGAGVLAVGFWYALNRHEGLVQFARIAGGSVGPQLAGGALFGSLNLAIFLALWLGVPLLTADAISRERREGTLGLLFLTPLRPAGVVLGKATVHILRALTLYLTMIPWLMVPVVLGGVGWADVAMAALVNAGILLVALAAGLVATTWSEDWVKTALLAEALSLVLGLVFLELYQGIAGQVLANWTPTPAAAGAPVSVAFSPSGTLLSPSFLPFSLGYSPPGLLAKLWALIGFATNYPAGMGMRVWNAAGMLLAPTSSWSMIWASYPAAAHAGWFAAVGALVMGSLATCGVAVGLAAVRVAASWRDQPLTRRETEVRRALFAPRFWPAALRSKAARALHRNPVGWLQQRSAQARLVKWGWCAVAMLTVVALAGETADVPAGLAWLQWLILLGLAFSAAASFRRERESGALELLLVTPLSPDQIIAGRLRGLWMQFLPAALVLAFAVNYLGTMVATAPGVWSVQPRPVTALLPNFLTDYLTLPVWGLFFSLRRLSFLGAWIATCAVGFGAPWLAHQGLLLAGSWTWWEEGSRVGAASFSHATDPAWSTIVTTLAFAVAAWWWLRRNLRRRDFVLRRRQSERV